MKIKKFAKSFTKPYKTSFWLLKDLFSPLVDIALIIYALFKISICLTYKTSYGKKLFIEGIKGFFEHSAKLMLSPVFMLRFFVKAPITVIKGFQLAEHSKAVRRAVASANTDERGYQQEVYIKYMSARKAGHPTEIYEIQDFIYEYDTHENGAYLKLFAKKPLAEKIEEAMSLFESIEAYDKKFLGDTTAFRNRI